MTSVRKSTFAIPLAFGCVYLFWGSTYLAIKVGVTYLPAMVLGATRFLVAGALMLLYCQIAGHRVLPTARQLGWLAAIGLLLLGGGNIGVVYGEAYVDSGFAALLVAIMPLYVALMNLLIPHAERLRARGWFGLALGFVGLFALLWPSMHLTGGHTQMIGAAVVLGAALSWGAGSVLSRELKLPVNPMVAAGWEMLIAGLACALGATLFHQWPQAHWNHSSIGAVAYLITFGSLVGYVSFVWLLHNVPISKVSTYAYVNPVVAVILGALLLKEHLNASGYIGMAAIVIAVAIVNSSKLAKQSVPVHAESRSEKCEV